MKDGKFETQKEIFEALLRGEKIAYHFWTNSYLEMVNGNLIDESGREACNSFCPVNHWSIYQEPKKKKTIEVKFYRYHYRVNYNNEKFQYLISKWYNEELFSMDKECFKEIDWRFCDQYDKDSKNLIKWSIIKTEERIETYEVEE